jgi:hypothetical protein
MNIAQLSEQLKDVPQGTLVGYAKNPNSVVPQFLALAEIQRRQSLQAPAPAPTGTVADDVLAQAAPPQMAPPQMAPQQIDPRLLQAQAMQQQAQQLPENQPGVTQLPSGMPQGMAAGGIVAFANGGLNIDDDEDDREMAQLFPKQSSSRFDQFQELLATLPSTVAGGIRGLAEKGAAKYKDVMSGVPSSVGEMRKDISNATSGATDNIEEFLAKIKHLESRGRSLDSKGNILTSPKGAQGSMQVMPKTQVNPGFGVTPARDKSPEELERVGREYGIAMLNEFQDPKLAAMAYNWGPANVKRWLASDRSTPIPKETRKYVSNFAEGGSVKRYAEGGLQDILGGDNYDLDTLRIEQIQAAKKLKEDKERYQFLQQNAPNVAAKMVNPVPPVPAVTAPAPAKPSVDGTKPIPQYGAMPSDDELRNMDIGFGSGRSNPAASALVPTEPAAPPKTQADLYAEALQEDIKSQAAKAAKEGKMTLAMSILQAGLGMMASKSPYALGGIGEGGQQGISTFAALKKQEADRAKDLMAARLGLYKYGAAQEGAAETREQNRIYREQVLGQRDATLAQRGEEIATRSEDRALDRLRQLDTSIEKNVSAEIKANPMLAMRPDVEQIIAQRVNAAKANNPLYARFHKLAGLGEFTVAPTGTAGLPPTVTKNGKTYVLQSNGKYIEK